MQAKKAVIVIFKLISIWNYLFKTLAQKIFKNVLLILIIFLKLCKTPLLQAPLCIPINKYNTEVQTNLT